MASTFTVFECRPRFHGPGGNVRPIKWKRIGSPYEAYSAMVLSATIAEYASAQSATASAAPALVQTATHGLRNRGETVASFGENGSPPSRAKAKSIREFEVTLERPQNHIAAIAIRTSPFPSRAPSALVSTKMNGLSAMTAFSRSPIESVTASSSAYPATPLTATDKTIPHGALRDGSCVSSLTCALAS